MFMPAHLSRTDGAILSISFYNALPAGFLKNRGGYAVGDIEMLEQQLSGEFDTEKRTELAIEMTQTLLDDHMFFFASHLKMSMVSGEGVTGLTAHPCDYYEITVNLDKNK